MHWMICAILTATLPTAAICGPDVLDQPVRVVFRLADNVRIDGTMTEWDRDGFDGSFGQRAWIELRTDDAWRLFRRLMDDENVEHWVDLGRMALMHGEDGKRYSRYAFRRALQIDPEMTARIEAVRRETAERRDELREEIETRRTAALRTVSPEAGDWSDSPWPEMLPAQRTAARLALFADAEAMLAKVDLTLEPVESDFFIVYSDAPRRDAAEWAVALDGWYRDVARTLGMDERTNIFWGKAVVFVLEDEDAFRVIEVGSFKQILPRGQKSVTHYLGPKTFINVVRQKDDVFLREALARELVHAFMHRYQSPRRLPPWAHEGFAEHFAQRVLDASPIHDGLRPMALRLVRRGFPVGAVLSVSFEDDRYPGPNREVIAIGYLMVEFLLKSGDQRFAEWVKSVKAGFDWQESLESTYEGAMGKFLASFVQFYRMND